MYRRRFVSGYHFVFVFKLFVCYYKYNIEQKIKNSNNIEKILDFLISETKTELNINLSPINFKRKKEKNYNNKNNIDQYLRLF